MHKIDTGALRSLAEELGPRVRLKEFNGATIIQHTRARLFLAEFNPDTSEVMVALEAAFPDHQELNGEELNEEALDLLAPRMKSLQNRGYELREIDARPGFPAGREVENEIPVVDVFLSRTIDTVEELREELRWLIDEIPLNA